MKKNMRMLFPHGFSPIVFLPNFQKLSKKIAQIKVINQILIVAANDHSDVPSSAQGHLKLQRTSLQLTFSLCYLV